MTHWGYWINEPIFMDKGVTNIFKRKHAIYCFCKEGLIPFVESAGYRFEYTDTKLFKLLLRLLYKLYEGHTVSPVVIEMPSADEQFTHFFQVLDTDAWDQFWKRWGQIQDFEPDGYAHKLQHELPGFVWSWIDFEKSPSVQQLYDELEETEYLDDAPKGKDDPYLQETSKRDYQDRHW